MVAKNCESCGAALSLTRDPRTRFCNRECWRASGGRSVFSAEEREKRSERMRQLNKRPDVQAKLIAFRASDRCPINQPENRRKLVEQQRVLGFPNLNYDSQPTVPQKMLFDALPGATMEFCLCQSNRGKRSLAVDIAIPSLKLAIEVDGLSHTKRSEKERDAKKEQVLRERGWTLLRFWNAEILGDLSAVLMRVRAAMVMLQKSERIMRHGSVA